MAIRKPTALKILQGNLGRRKINTKEPRPRNVIPMCPAWLDADGKRTFKALAPKLVKLGLLTEVDGTSFGHLCQVRSRILAATRFLNKENPSLVEETTYVDSTGQEHNTIKQSVYLKIEKEMFDLFRKAAGDFGLTPRGRAGLSVSTGKKDDKTLEDLLD